MPRKAPPKRAPLILSERFEVLFEPAMTLATKFAAERLHMSAAEYIRLATAAALKRDGIDCPVKPNRGTRKEQLTELRP